MRRDVGASGGAPPVRDSQEKTEGRVATESELWIEPESAFAEGADEGPVLSPDQLESWRERGFALVDAVLPQSGLMAARRVIDGLLPAAGEKYEVRDFGSGRRLGFPPPGHAHWTPERLEAVRARYGPLGMDMTPYQKP